MARLGTNYMEEKQQQFSPPSAPTPKKKDHHPEVVVLRGWKEYLGESLLIIFSVVLALILTEVISKIHEHQETKQLLHDVREELTQNKIKTQEQFDYEMKVLGNIDSALKNPSFAKQIVSDGEFHLQLIAPNGVLYRYLYDVAWQVAKERGISSKISLKDLAALTHIYAEQEHIKKVEEEIARIFFDRQSRSPANIRETLVLIRDGYHAWAVDRVPGLLEEYQTEIDNLK